MYPALALWIWNEAIQTAVVKSFSAATTTATADAAAAPAAQSVPKAPNVIPLLPMSMRIRLDHLRDANHSLLTATRFGADRYRSM